MNASPTKNDNQETSTFDSISFIIFLGDLFGSSARNGGSDVSILDSNLNLYTGLDGNGGDLANNIRRTVQVDNSLVDSHLKTIPGVSTLTIMSGADWKKVTRGSEPSPQGDLRVVMTSVLVGSLMGPRTRRRCSVAPRIRSAQTEIR